MLIDAIADGEFTRLRIADWVHAAENADPNAGHCGRICRLNSQITCKWRESEAPDGWRHCCSVPHRESKGCGAAETDREFFTRVIKLCDELPKTVAARKISEQLLDSAGSTDSNYGAACKARSTGEFIAKIGVAAEEADESKRWLLRLVDANLCTAERAKNLIQEGSRTDVDFRPLSKDSAGQSAAPEKRRGAAAANEAQIFTPP